MSKRLVGQARIVWFFSRLAQSKYGRTEHLKAAKHGYDFLYSRMWDAHYGGFYWEVDAACSMVTKPDKHLYGQAFAQELQGILQLRQQRETSSTFLKLTPMTDVMAVIGNFSSAIGKFLNTTAIWGLHQQSS